QNPSWYRGIARRERPSALWLPRFESLRRQGLLVAAELEFLWHLCTEWRRFSAARRFSPAHVQHARIAATNLNRFQQFQTAVRNIEPAGLTRAAGQRPQSL